MKKLYRSAMFAVTAVCLFLIPGPDQLHAQSIQQQLIVVLNDGVHFNIELQVKGTALSGANTLGSATVDVQFDNTKLTYVGATNWAPAISPDSGYSRSATNDLTFIRIGITGGSVNANNNGTPPGFDINTTYATWVQLQFTTVDANQTTNVTIDNGSNAIGLFENHANSPNTGAINNQTLSAPVNISNQILPITLSSLTVTPSSAGGATIDWTTLSEIDCYGFYVQKSNAPSTGYHDIPGSFTAGNGTTSAQHSYSFTDPSASTGTWYYRLREVDLNGSVHYSEPVLANGLTSAPETGIPTTFSLSQNYPNPFNPTTMIRYALPVRNHVLLTVHNALGQKVAELVDEVVEAGYHDVQFNGAALASGIYYYRIRAGAFVETKSLLLLK